MIEYTKAINIFAPKKIMLIFKLINVVRNIPITLIKKPYAMIKDINPNLSQFSRFFEYINFILVREDEINKGIAKTNSKVRNKSVFKIWGLIAKINVRSVKQITSKERFKSILNFDLFIQISSSLFMVEIASPGL